MESPGEYLKRERELRRVSIGKIFEATRIPLKYLEALESNNYEALPHPTFVKGFIKSYCKTLGVDENDAVLRYEIYLKERAPEKWEPQKLVFPSIKEEPEGLRLPREAKKYIGYAVGVVVVLAIVIYLYSRGSESSNVQLVQEQGQTSSEPVASVAEKAVETTAPAAPAGKPVPARPAAQEAAQGAPQAAAPVKAAEPEQASTILQQTLTMKANEVTWVKVRIDNQEPFDVILRQGDSVTWKANSAFSLLVGNAGGVDVFYNGSKLSTLGRSGESVALKLPRKDAPVRQGAPQQKKPE